MKKMIYLTLCVAVIMFSVVACKKKKAATPSPDCSGLTVTATVNGTTATPNPTGGAAPYQYSQDGVNYVTETQVTGLKYGSNTIYVKDANSCIASTVAACSIVTDTRDGQIYTTTAFGNQVWMMRNINYNVSGSLAYNNSVDSSTKYGRLYTYAQATQACPVGWELPSDTAWKTLEMNLGMTQQQVNIVSTTFGDRGSAATTIQPGTNFNALYGGVYYTGTGYKLIDTTTGFWTSTFGCSRLIKVGGASIVRYTSDAAANGYSVRCVKSSY